jgi:predicted dehydrogenase
MIERYRLAFIGGGADSIAGRPHLTAARMDNLFTVDAGAFSRNPDTNRETAKKFGVERSYDDWRAMLDAEAGNVDAVVILTPTPAHAEMIEVSLERNIPVICEKPLVDTVAEMESIRQRFDASKNFLVVTNNYSGYPMVRELRERIRQGVLGNIHSIRVDMPQESFLRPPKSVKYPQKWRLHDGEVPMICHDLGTHCFHLADFLLDETPTKVWADYCKVSKYGVVDDVNIRHRYPSGINGEMWFSKVALGNRNGLSISVFGDKASAYWQQVNPELMEFANSDGDRVTIDRGGDMVMATPPQYNRMTPGHPAGFIEAFGNLYADIHDSLTCYRNAEPYLSDLCYGIDQAEQAIRFFAAAGEASATGHWVDIES